MSRSQTADEGGGSAGLASNGVPGSVSSNELGISFASPSRPSPVFPQMTQAQSPYSALAPISPTQLPPPLALPLSPRALLAQDPSAGPSSDFFLLMRNATGEEDAEDLGAPAIGLEPTSPVVTRRLDSAEVKRRRSVVGNIRLGSSDDDRSEHESEEEHDRESDRGSVRDRPGGSDGRSGRETTSTHSTASLRSDHRTLDLKFLAKWQDANLKSHSTGAKKEENGRIPPYRAGTNTSLTNSSAYEMATTPPQTDRFTLYSPSLTEPMPSSTFNFAPSLLSSQPWFWIDVLDPTDSEMLMFSRVFHLHPLTSEDIIEGRIRRDGFGQVGSEGREKLELYPGYSFVLVRALDPKEDETGVDADEIEGVNLNIVVSMNSGKEGRVPWILSFHSRPLHAPQQVRARHTMLQKYDMSAGVDWICYALLDAVVDSFMPETRSTEMEAESIEDLVLMLRKESQEELLRRINESKRRVTGLMKLLQGKPATIKSMRRRLLAHYTDLGISELALYLSDVGDNVVGMQSNLQFQDQTLARAHGTYLARVQIEIQGSTASSNDMTNKVTLLASIIVPLNLLTGMWGMNMRVPFMADANESLLPFICFSIIVACIIGAVLTYARFKGMV